MSKDEPNIPNRWFNSPVITFTIGSILGVVLPAIISVLEVWQNNIAITNNQTQAEKSRQHELYQIFLANKDIIFLDNNKNCKSFTAVTVSVYGKDEELSPILERLADYVEDQDCQKILKGGAEEVNFIQISQPSKKEKEETEQKATNITNSENSDAEIANLVPQLTGDNRKTVSLVLIDLATNKGKKKLVVNSLISGIVDNGEQNEYRKNLYVAYTLSKIDNWGSGLSGEQITQFCKLKTSQYYTGDKANSTFQRRVDQAIASSGKPDLCQ